MYNIIFFLLVSCFMNSCSPQYTAKNSNHFTNEDPLSCNTDDSYNYCNFITEVINETSLF